jgi:hypothetical protein
MKLVTIAVKGIYGRPGSLLPASMARLTPDAAASLAQVEAEIERLGGCFRLSDAYRSSAMQARAHDDYIKGRKHAYSPPAGSSMHEAGRAIDLDLAALIHPPSVPKGSQTLNELKVRALFEAHGWTFIAPAGNPHSVDVKESWHIEFRGPFQETYDSVFKRANVHSKAYHSMAAAAIADLANDNWEGGLEGGEEEERGAAFAPATGLEDGVVKKADPEAPGAVPMGVHGQDAHATTAGVTSTVVPEARGAVPGEVHGQDAHATTVAAPQSVGEKLRTSTTLLHSLGIQGSAIVTAVGAFLLGHKDQLLYILGGAGVMSLIGYGIYCWKEVQAKRIGK